MYLDIAIGGRIFFNYFILTLGTQFLKINAKMKKFFLVILLLNLSSHCFSQWYVVDSLGFDADCDYYPIPNDLQFINPDVAYWSWSRDACSPTNTGYFYINRTTNSFQTTQGFKGCSDYGYLSDNDIISADTAFLYYVCYQYIFEKTYDGGATWTSLSTNRPEDIFFINGHLGYGFTGNDLYRFYNDSIYFVNTVTGFSINNYTMHFMDSLTGIIMLWPSQNDYSIDKMMRTTDGGMTWNQVSLDSTRTFYPQIEALNDSIVYLRADSGYIYKTIDKGNSWFVALQNDTMGFIHFLNETHFYSTTTDSLSNVYYNTTVDSGLHWSSHPVSISNLFNPRVKMFNDSVGYIVGMAFIGNWYEEVILKTRNGGVSTGSFPEYYSDFLITPNPNSGNFSIRIPSEMMHTECTLRIVDVLGRVIIEKDIKSDTESIQINFTGNSIGIYNVALYNWKNNYTAKFVLE